MFIFPIHQPGIEVHRIEMLNGSKEFCQEFLTDVRVPDTDRVGDVDDGWTVGTRWMFHERTRWARLAVRDRDRASAGARATAATRWSSSAGATGQLDDPRHRELIGEAHDARLVREQRSRRASRRACARA